MQQGVILLAAGAAFTQLILGGHAAYFFVGLGCAAYFAVFRHEAVAEDHDLICEEDMPCSGSCRRNW